MQDFLTPDGNLAFSSWEQIPYELRCCVEGLTRKVTGDTETLELKLVNRNNAWKELKALMPNLAPTPKISLVHKTVGAGGEEVGIDINAIVSLPDDKLRELLVDRED